MAPLTATQVIPPGWQEHHQPVAQGTMTGLCDLYRTGAAPPVDAPDDWDGRELIAAGVRCRVQELRESSQTVAVEQPTTQRRYLVTLPATVPALPVGERGSIVTNFRPAHPGTFFDPHLHDRVLNVIDVQHGTLLWERDIICVDNLTQNQEAPDAD